VSDPRPVRPRRERVRPTGRALLLGTLGALLYGAGANVSAGWVVVVAAVSLASLPWALVSALRASSRLEITRSLPASATAGVAVGVRLEVTAPTTAMVVVHDTLTGAVGVATGLRRTVSLEGDAPLRRGAQASGLVRVELSDPFGLVRVVCAGEVPADGVALPAVPPLRRGATDASWAITAGGEASRTGDGTETMGVREYRPGDPIRGVHWRSTARRGQLVVRELAEPSRARVDVVIGAGAWEVAALDRATVVAAAVAEDATGRGHPTTLAADGRREPWPAGSAGQRERLALLPPHAGAPARPLAGTTPSSAEVTVEVAPRGADAWVRLVRGGRVDDLGPVPPTDDPAALGAWVSLRLEAVGTEVAG
jgi:uncharacterized protein (DUF58 family)